MFAYTHIQVHTYVCIYAYVTYLFIFVCVVLLAGYRTECKLSFETGDETVIPEGSSVRVMLNRDVQCNFSGLNTYVQMYVYVITMT